VKIKAKNVTLDPVRTAAETAKIRYQDDDGNWQEGETRVSYRSPTTKGFRSRDSILQEKGDKATYAELLFDYVECLPDIIEDVETENSETGEKEIKEVPVEVTLELFDNMHVSNLQEIYRVIQEDLNPKSQPASSPAISEPKAKKATRSRG
jgi:hypothetical protein